MSKIFQEGFQSSCRLEQLFLDASAVILQKKSEIIEKFFFPALKMKFENQEINVQIQTFTDENRSILHSCFLERY